MEIADKFLNLSPEEVQAESLRVEHEIEDEMSKIKKWCICSYIIYSEYPESYFFL